MSTIFVSSTFQDMQQERDILQNDVLPRVKELAKQYGKNIDLCDLRWGVNSIGMNESESTAKVLQVCFDEIDNARPFFIAILGDRYGWIPESDIVENSTMGRNIESRDMLGKSVTEMEIIYGALKNADSSDIRFYFRDIRNKRRGLFANPDIPKNFVSESSDDKKRMKALKAKIQENFSQQIRTYSVTWDKDSSRFEGMGQFAEMLYKDIEEMIVQRWGPIPKLSEYEYQLHQYQYAMDCDDIFVDISEPLLSSRAHPDNQKLNDSMMHSQNYVLISEDENSLNMLFSSLCRRYQSSGAVVIPYECSQSVLSASTDNLVRYFTNVLGEYFEQVAKIADHTLTKAKTKNAEALQTLLGALDAELDIPLILAIRNINYLDKENIFDWFPIREYNHIHFIISSNKVFSSPSQFKELTTEFYFQGNNIFSRSRFIKAYMANHHKELDDQVFYALLDKADNKDDQYLELLMQRLLVLSQDDFEKIKNSGDGMEKISQHLQKLIAESPDNVADFLLKQLSCLDKETSSGFSKAVLTILSILPYGISRSDLIGVLNLGHISFSMLDMTLLCRRLSTIVNVTIDGYYRLKKTSLSKFISDNLIVERHEWSELLERYMSGENSADLGGNKKICDNEFYRSQYLEVALRTQKRTAINQYLKNLNYDANYIALILYRLTLNEELNDNLIKNFEELPDEDVKWLITEFYDYLADKKILLNKAFALNLKRFWKSILLRVINEKKTSEEKNYMRFSLLYQLGELSYLHDEDDADTYLIEAKKVSKENFRQYPNRLWKTMHGIELTDEEKRRGYDSLGAERLPVDGDSIMFGFSGEVEDMEFEQSWSIRVRVINNYLSQIFRKKGNVQAAEELEAESRKLTHMSDPDPQRKGNKEIVPGISIVWPDELDNEECGKQRVRKRAYKPDLRRNSAIQLAKEARKLRTEGNKEGAIAKYEESNEILKEIYKDGETGEYYDLKDVDENPRELAKMIRMECARDIGVNYSGMVYASKIDESNVSLLSYLDDMISWAQRYDDYRNNKQSKSDMEQYYLLSAEVYDMFENAAYFERIVQDIDKYLTYRLEAHMKGEQTDEKIVEDRTKANRILYRSLIKNPQAGAQITDLLLKQSNASVKANDFNGFLHLTYLTESLLKWMWENSYDWKGMHCSLEYIFFNNISNQCMLWEQHHMDDRLKQDADRIVAILSNARESGNVLLGIQSILRYAVSVFRSGEYDSTIPYANAVLDVLQKTGGLPDIELADIYERLLAMYSEAALFDKALVVAQYNEDLLKNMEQKGYCDELRLPNITPSQYKSFVVSKTIIAYLNHAVALSRMEKQDDAQRYLCLAEDLATKYPEIANGEAGIMQRISLFKKNGLPKPKKEEDSEKTYRKYKNEIETTLSRCLKQEPYDLALLQRVVHLIEEMTGMPEHDIYKSTYTVAKYYHVLNMLFASVGNKELSFAMLQRAALLADEDDDKEELYAEIFSDICAYTNEKQRKLSFSQKALAIYEDLQKNGKEYSHNSYAMTLYNAAIILMEQGGWKNALAYAKKAHSIWNTLLLTTNDQQIRSYVAEAQRLVAFLEPKANQSN